MTAGMTLGEIYWDAANDARPHGSWRQLSADYRERIEAGAAAVATAAIQRRTDELDSQRSPEPEDRYALVEQMGHRATVASVRETTFCGAPMLEVTDLKTGSVHLAAPQSLYEVSWLTEDEARARAKPWTAAALPAGQLLAYDEDAEGDEIDAEDDL